MTLMMVMQIFNKFGKINEKIIEISCFSVINQFFFFENYRSKFRSNLVEGRFARNFSLKKSRPTNFQKNFD